MVPDVNAAPARVLAALSAAGDVAYVWDLESDAMIWHGSPRMLGLTDEESVATGKGFAGRINPEDLLLRQQRLQSHYNRGAAFDVEYRVRLGNGGFVWLHERGSVEPRHGRAPVPHARRAARS